MGVKVSGLIDSETMLLNIDSTLKRRARKVLVREAEKVQKLAIKMAPVDHGGLEEAIKITGNDATTARDELGRFARVEVEVYVDMEAPGKDPNRGDVKVGDYAYEIHEHLEPVGEMKRGPKSNQKNSTNGGVEVGGGFMTRAALVIDDRIEEELKQILSGIV